jgi:hypothetical protein
MSATSSFLQDAGPRRAKRVPQSEILTLLHDSLSHAGADVEMLIQRLETAHRGTTAEEKGEHLSLLTTEQLIALGFLACVKAIRESGLMGEIAVREEIQQIHDLAAEMRAAFARTEAIVKSNRELLADLEARRWETTAPEAT